MCLHLTISDTHEQEGVPQGAVLSTTLFNVKVNDIAKTLGLGVECSLYVDDFIVCYRAPDTLNIEKYYSGRYILKKMVFKKWIHYFR